MTTMMMMMGYLGEMRSVCVPNPNIVEREDGGVDYSMGISTVYGSPSQIKASR